MLREVDCPDCDGVGRLEDRKGKEYTCPSCKGKGKIHEESYEKDQTETDLGED